MKRRPRKRERSSASAELAALREQLADAQTTLQAIRSGEVDALVVEGELGPQVYTLEGAEFDYRILVESMSEGALVLTSTAVILYANSGFAALAGRPLAQVMGRSLSELLSDADHVVLRRLLNGRGPMDARAELALLRPGAEPLPVQASVLPLPGGRGKDPSIGMVVSDLTEFRNREHLLRHFSRVLMQMREAERTQIAMDLGDDITQLLCAILVRGQSFVDRLPAHESGFREEAAEFAALLRTTARAVHGLSARLRPHGLEILGLASALREVAAEFSERMGVPIEVCCAELAARLPADTELTIYRVLLEALRNVEQHAQAHHVRVALHCRDGAVELAVQDDGIGFDASDLTSLALRAGSIGLLGMRERAMAVGGSLQLKSTASSGTEVLLSVPLPRKSAAAG